ncbi:MAG: hypothetical protein AAGJ94_01685, partial [Pseudomonadota bacterium]
AVVAQGADRVRLPLPKCRRPRLPSGIDPGGLDGWIVSAIRPSIDIQRSGTRKEELLVKKEDLKKVYVLRRILNPMGSVDAIEFLLDKLRQTKNNAEFFDSMNT